MPKTSALAVLILFAIVLQWAMQNRNSLPYPPGPPPNIFLGNLKDFPEMKHWETYTELGKVYGDIIHLTLLGDHYVILNSVVDAQALLEKRSNIYSDRSRFHVLEIAEFNVNTGLLPYTSPAWRKHRTVYQQSLIRPRGLHVFRPIHEKKVNDMLYHLIDTPEEFMNHHRTFAGAVIMAVMYGHDIAPKNDRLIAIAEETMSRCTRCILSPSAIVVNAFPLLRFLPPWFPGAGFKRMALEARSYMRQMINLPADMVEKQMAAGTASPSIVADLLETMKSPEEYPHIKSLAVAAYAAGADTTSATLSVFFYLMARYPDVQLKAQQQIAEIVGTQRLPSFNDRVSLPYIDALLREVLRIYPVIPTGIPHRLTEDDVYQGYLLPKGTIVIANLWAINRDPRLFSDPERFNPERFLNKDGTLNTTDIYSFGFGKRICAGRAFASESIWLAIARVLATLDIRPKINDLGHESLLPDIEFSDGATIHPLHFECSITPRSETAKQLIVEGISSNDRPNTGH